MKLHPVTIFFLAGNMRLQADVEKAHPFGLIEAEKYIRKHYVETAMLIKIKIGDSEIYNPDYREFEIETVLSELLTNKNHKK